MTIAAPSLLPAAQAPPAEAFPDWPAGWFVAATSDQLSSKPLGVNLFGRQLVCYRASSGQPIVMDARCWHMGADLSDGIVRGDQIICPFHGWQYGPDGQCESIPAQTEIPACARQETYPTAEFDGRIFVFSPTANAYPLPFFAGTQPNELIAAHPFEFTIACPWWLVGTNGFHLQHFSVAHDRRLVGAPKIESGHPSSRRIVATFEVCGNNLSDRLTRRFAGRYVTMDVTV